jgi:RNA polymerase sigma factor (sigma-70 family)
MAIEQAIGLERYRNMADHELLAECRVGNSDAYGEVYSRYSSRMFNVACRLHGNSGDAEDSLQDAFISAYQNLQQFDERAQFSTWLYRILVNTCMSRLRKPSSRMEHLDMMDEHLHPRVSAERDAVLSALLEQEISRLPFIQRSVFVLHATDGHTHEEIAEILHIRPGASKSSYHRARKTLRDRLDKKGISSGGA